MKEEYVRGRGSEGRICKEGERVMEEYVRRGREIRKNMYGGRGSERGICKEGEGVKDKCWRREKEPRRICDDE